MQAIDNRLKESNRQDHCHQFAPIRGTHSDGLTLVMTNGHTVIAVSTPSNNRRVCNGVKWKPSFEFRTMSSATVGIIFYLSNLKVLSPVSVMGNELFLW